MTAVDPLTIRCSWCCAPAGVVCLKDDAYGNGVPARKTHKARIRLATAVAAHADPVLDEWPQLGPVSDCRLCGSGLPQRHRIVDAIAGHLDAGEYPAEIADELAVPEGAALAVQAWAERWPGAWR